MSEKVFTREQMADLPCRLLRDGHVANARVSVYEVNGKQWTVKDFSGRPWWVRYILAPLLLGHELSVINRLGAIEGVAGQAFRIDGCALAIEFMPGTPLGKMPEKDYTPAFFEAMETLLKRVHEREIVHLDTRGSGNWLVSPQGKPILIDFQSALSTAWMPKGLKRFARSVDLSGVYKKWHALMPESMDQERLRAFEKGEKHRAKWKIRGYFGAHKTSKK